MKTERVMTAKVCRVLRSQGAMVYPVIAGAPGAPAGWPDRIVWHRIWRGLLEFKACGTPLGALQAKTIRDLCARAPGSAWVVRGRAGDDNRVAIEDADGVSYCECLMTDLLKSLRDLCAHLST